MQKVIALSMLILCITSFSADSEITFHEAHDLYTYSLHAGNKEFRSTYNSSCDGYSCSVQGRVENLRQYVEGISIDDPDGSLFRCFKQLYDSQQKFIKSEIINTEIYVVKQE